MYPSKCTYAIQFLCKTLYMQVQTYDTPKNMILMYRSWLWRSKQNCYKWIKVEFLCCLVRFPVRGGAMLALSWQRIGTYVRLEWQNQLCNFKLGNYLNLSQATKSIMRLTLCETWTRLWSRCHDDSSPSFCRASTKVPELTYRPIKDSLEHALSLPGGPQSGALARALAQWLVGGSWCTSLRISLRICC